MRKLVYAINLTLDGCCDHTKGLVDADLHNFHAQLLGTSDTFLYGRKTYELMVPFWPDIAKNNSGEDKAMNDFAHAFDAVKKIVVISKTLKKPADNRTVIIDSNLEEEILKLKKQEGKAILMGGVDVPSQLIKLGLVDEFHFLYQPTLAGEGRRLFDDLSIEQEKLQLKESKTFNSGTVALRYTKGK